MQSSNHTAGGLFRSSQHHAACHESDEAFHLAPLFISAPALRENTICPIHLPYTRSVASYQPEPLNCLQIDPRDGEGEQAAATGYRGTKVSKILT